MPQYKGSKIGNGQRLRLALLACIIFSCSVSLFTFHLALITWGDCVEFGSYQQIPSPDPNNTVRSPQWDYFDHIYCLHSHTLVEREEHIHNAVKLLHLEKDVHWWDAQIDLENGHRGVWHSHRSIARHALANNFSRIVVFEDDILVEPILEAGIDSVLQRITKFLKSTPTWEVFFFSHNCKKLELTPNPEFVRVGSWSTVAFALNKRGIYKLANSEYDITTTVDSLLFENKHAYSIYPMVMQHKPNKSYTMKENRTDDVNKIWRMQEDVLFEDALVRNTFACSTPYRRAWGQLSYTPPRMP